MPRQPCLHLALLILFPALVFVHSEAAAAGTPRECYPGYFMCVNGLCIPNKLVCDGEINCITGNDETNCTREAAPGSPRECYTGYFMCADGLCIPDKLVCDGELNCITGNDENHCPAPAAAAAPVSGKTDGCFPGYFECSNGLCIPENLVCNGEINCILGNDEDNC